MSKDLSKKFQCGFTFIEVLIAILIFTLVVVAAVGIIKGSVRATQESKVLTSASWLLQSKMVELETNIDTLGVDKACDKKKSGKFEAPNEKFSWLTNCTEIDFRLPEATSLVSANSKDSDSSEEKSTTENEMQKMVFGTASDYLSKSLRELHAEITWNEGKTLRKITVTTEWARFDQPLNIPGMGSATGTAAGGNPTSPTTTPSTTTAPH